MNENSPIWVRQKPDCMAMRSGWPITSIPVVPNKIMPTITTIERMVMVPAFCVITVGSTSIPTEIKNTAPKRFFTGVMICSMRSASVVPARIEPMIKAPSANE